MKSDGKKFFDDPHDEIDRLIDRKPEHRPDLMSKSEQLQKTYDNLVFRKTVRDNPLTVKHEIKVFGYETVSLNEFLALRLWPRSIYVTDKLLRLVASSKLEALKRYVQKKRAVPMNMIWILLIIFGVVIVIIVILFLLPSLGVM
jgi:hypothetical protein